jgi:hypothetical protein
MAIPTTKAECDKRGWYWNAKDGVCEKPSIDDIKMTLTRGSGCDGPNHNTVIPLPANLSASVRNALLNASRRKAKAKKTRPRRKPGT